ncbi:MAG: hypothetical protein HY291_05900 [Planctomycetes bacterium]|nr:hypothetical protein [Planctomycetota bacterium]
MRKFPPVFAVLALLALCCSGAELPPAKDIEVTRYGFKVVCKPMPEAVEIGARVSLECTVTWMGEAFDREEIRRMASELADEDFEVRAAAESGIYGQLSQLTLSLALPELDALADGCEDEEARARLNAIRTRLNAREESEVPRASMRPQFELEMQARPEHGAPSRVYATPVSCGANPFLAAGPIEIKFGDDYRTWLEVDAAVPPGNYRVRIRFYDGRYASATSAPFDVSTPWQDFRVLPRTCRSCPGLSNFLPENWTYLGEFKNRSASSDWRQELLNPPGWRYAGPLTLDDKLRILTTFDWRVHSVRLANLATWRRPSEEVDGYRFEGRAELFRFPHAYEGAPQSASSERPASYLGATATGRWFLHAEGPGSEELLAAIRSWVAAHAVEPECAARDERDVTRRLADRKSKRELFDWLMAARQASEQTFQRLVEHPAVEKALNAEVELFLDPAEEAFAKHEDYAAQDVARYLFQVAREKGKRSLLRLLANGSTEVKRLALGVLEDLMRDPACAFRRDTEIQAALEQGICHDDKDLFRHYLGVLCLHDSLAPGLVPLLVSSAERDVGRDRSPLFEGYWAYLESIVGDDPAWIRANDGYAYARSPQAVMKWWHAAGSQTSWPAPEWATQVAQRLRHWQAEDEREPAK